MDTQELQEVLDLILLDYDGGGCTYYGALDRMIQATVECGSGYALVRFDYAMAELQKMYLHYSQPSNAHSR